VRARTLLGDDEAVAAGVSTPGLVDPHTGIVIAAKNLAGWQQVPLAAMLAERLGCPVHVENDVNMAALGEVWRGAGRRAIDVAFIGVGTGVGVGLVLGGRLHRGHRFSAGEVNPLPSGIAADGG
jgi:predicted NBD/HSP70 family sugar kinase